MNEKAPAPKPPLSSETYHIPESTQKEIDSMSTYAQDIATEHERLATIDDEVVSVHDKPAPNETPSREKLYGQLHALLEKRVKEEGLKSVAESEDFLQEYLIDFWENDEHKLSVEQKNEIIGQIIDQTQRETEARKEVDEALKDNESVDSPEDDQIDQGDPVEAKTLEQEAVKPDNQELTQEQQEEVARIQAEIDAIDLMSNYTMRLKKITEYAKEYNGKKDPLGRDIGVLAAQRIDKSSARRIFNPRRYTIRFGKSRRLYNDLLADMATSGLNLDAAKAMKRNLDPRYRKITPGKNETIFEISKIIETNIATLPGKINKSNELIAAYKKDIEDGGRDTLIARLEELAQQRTQLLEEYQNGDIDRLGQKRINSISTEIATIETQLSRLDRMESAMKKEQTGLEKNQKTLHDSLVTRQVVDDAVDPTFSGAAKYAAMIVADRAVQHNNLQVLGDVLGYEKIKQDAAAKIITSIYRKEHQAANSEREKAAAKLKAINAVGQYITIRSIKDEAMKSIV